VLDVPPSTKPAPEAVLDGHNQVDFAAVHGPVRKWAGAGKTHAHPRKTRHARRTARVSFPSLTKKQVIAGGDSGRSLVRRWNSGGF
jgi:hypothetical protein